MSIRVYPLIEPNLTVGQYLDRFEHKGTVWDVRPPKPVTDSPDLGVEKFWGKVVATWEAMKLEAPPCGVCAQPCIDPTYEKYLVCSERCENIASTQADEAQDV